MNGSLLGGMIFVDTFCCELRALKVLIICDFYFLNKSTSFLNSVELLSPFSLLMYYHKMSSKTISFSLRALHSNKLLMHTMDPEDELLEKLGSRSHYQKNLKKH